MYEVSEQEALANGDEILAIVSEGSTIQQNHHENTAETIANHHIQQHQQHGGVEVDETGFEWSVTYGIDGSAEAASTLAAPARRYVCQVVTLQVYTVRASMLTRSTASHRCIHNACGYSCDTDTVLVIASLVPCRSLTRLHHLCVLCILLLSQLQNTKEYSCIRCTMGCITKTNIRVY